jgi:hypothetical protein
MNMHVKISTAVLAEKKGLSVVKQTNLKTKSLLELNLTEKDSDVQELLAKDISALKAKGQKMDVVITVEGAKALGRLINRSASAMGRMGFVVQPLDWDAGAGEISIMADDLTGMDIPFLVEVLLRVARRATQKIGFTQHPLTIYDLKQTIGLVQDLRQEVDGAEDLSNWFSSRELAILEEEKAAKAEARKAKAAAAKGKAKEKALATAKEKPSSGKAKNGKTVRKADLANLT